ncbi:hypothetical protein Tco_0980708, partial [Tanacetum coccineum]
IKCEVQRRNEGGLSIQEEPPQMKPNQGDHNMSFKTCKLKTKMTNRCRMNGLSKITQKMSLVTGNNHDPHCIMMRTYRSSDLEEDAADSPSKLAENGSDSSTKTHEIGFSWAVDHDRQVGQNLNEGNKCFCSMWMIFEWLDVSPYSIHCN